MTLRHSFTREDILPSRPALHFPRYRDPSLLALSTRRPLIYSLLRGWVNDCQEWHHGIFYPPSQVDPTWPIRLIDCKTRLVIEVAHLTRPCPPFLALSYVWGQVVDQPDRPSDHSQPLENLPRTVRDSMVVTLRLGFRYLWIDKYCIRQDDEEDKQRQIRLMTGIYGGAQVILVAAGGSDPTYGLPGVSRARQFLQPRVRLKNRTLVLGYDLGTIKDSVSMST
ncbi:HET-domain-containing protein [Canariomyces notabilis]|uniref:HET-domain-containing protein n=1 Tax=Canariomyces notabilis TaxID=2074819 RepID=A0AAN6YTK6_9PEZI|nr:HET-domain-containing protein [Canariomyces arenarius]